MNYQTERRTIEGRLVELDRFRDAVYELLPESSLELLHDIHQKRCFYEALISLKCLAGRWHRRAVLRGDLPNPTTPEENQALWLYEPRGNR